MHILFHIIIHLYSFNFKIGEPHLATRWQQCRILKTSQIKSLSRGVNFINSPCVLLKYAFTLSGKKGLFHFGIGKMSLNAELLET